MIRLHERPGRVLLQGNAQALPLRAGTIQTVVTSPPYWGLRDYGVAEQIGLEPTPERYVAHLVEVFREVRRVLRDDGTVWLNLGDSYATGAGKVGDHPGGVAQGQRWKEYGPARAQVPDGKNPGAGIPTYQPNRMPLPGLKPKDLVGIPWRVAFALQADGWWLRADIIWSKPNPMPESITDRPTKAHEYLFLLAKSARYYYDAEAIREPWADARQGRDYKTPDGWDTSAGAGGHGTIHRAGREAGHKDWRPASERNRGGRTDGYTKPNNIDPSANGGRNRRSVWTLATEPYPEAHFATFPEKLVEPCVLAGSRPGDRVLDPFAGSGTTVAVAERLGRVGIGVELKAAYLMLAHQRTRQAGLL